MMEFTQFTELLPTALLVLFAGLALHRVAIRSALRFGLMDIPSARKRHTDSKPVIGGVSLFLSWAFGLILYVGQNPEWLDRNSTTVAAVATGITILLLMGLADDIYGLGPYIKLLVQAAAAGVVLIYEPTIHALLSYWQTIIGVMVWPLGMIWLVGITNAINLIDGMDGLAGGMSLLVASSILVLSAWSTPAAEFGFVAVGLLIPAIISFLRYNWNPAKIFLGDNGSLPLGFLLGTTALMARPQNKSWIMIVSVVLMLGYPILDMGLCTFRRSRHNLPLFKADRNHLHHRLQHMGLSVKQTAVMLLSLGFFLQVSALSVNLMSPPSATLGIAVIAFAIFVMLFLIETLEKIRLKQRVEKIRAVENASSTGPAEQLYPILNIDLRPLLEVGDSEDSQNFRRIREALELMLRSAVRQEDQLLASPDSIQIILTQLNFEDESARKTVIQSFEKRLRDFLDLYNIHSSLSNLPIEITIEKCAVRRDGAEIIPLRRKHAA